jgi:NAD(P)H-hydrate epimerase
MRMMIEEEVQALLPPLKRSRHKYQAGYVCALAGSPSYSGAAILSAWAAMRAGAGIVRLFHPDGMQHELAASPVELIKTPYRYDEWEKVLAHMNKSSSVLIGPGIGLSEEVCEFIRQILPRIEVPCVIDADALTIIAKEDITLPERTILTPHRGEMMRLLHSEEKEPLNENLLNECREYANKREVTLILKGGPSFIFHPGQPITVNPTGDPGMATAGCGDVLTGVLAGLLAQGLYPQHAAQLGVFIHGLSGEFAAAMESSYSMTASDVVDFLAEAYLRLQ